ncbi:MAG: GIY-YIG nuclease family protein [Brevundimonas sp.]|uniref:GIY-YIG nuclease family protein n=1 Tax=Brevundimonas sp. TaxID=1871086 RepID=UPI002736B842|nr:GIY-YIG nuclease family protein [Brevundimonas sp.]MDP3378659.1 GIY-YIG nuclease family protein [Brevundimonas sp.]
MREHILGEIRRLATANGGQPPGQIAFARDTGIAENQWLGKFWARWSDAVIEAGYEPNAWQMPLDREGILDQIVAACRHYGRVPTKAERDLFRISNPGLPSNNAVARHFGSRLDLIAALAKRAADDDNYADIAAMLPTGRVIARADKPAPARTPDGFVYLIKSGEFYKIGRGDDLERRVKQITVALPDKATLVHSIRTDDPPGIEAYWHRRFTEKRANGEWFKLSSLDVSAFKKRKFQ